MSKYYKAEEVQTLINSLKCYGIPELNLDGLPTIDIVKCKGCVKHKTHKCHMAFDLVATEDNDFCSWGERIEE